MPNISPSLSGRRPIRIGGLSATELLRALAAREVRLNAAALELFDHPRFVVAATETLIESVEMPVAELGLAEGATMPVILAAARRLGLVPCPLETGPHLRLQYADQGEGVLGVGATTGRAPPGSLTVVSEPIAISDDVPKGFYLRRVEGVLWLRGYRSDDLHRWSPEDRLLFRCA